jgi:PPK2 family polyphosphate:nucleotide phosphotransferase
MDQYRVQAGKSVSLAKHDPADTSGFPAGKADAKKHLDGLSARLDALQELLYAEGKHRLLIVLQGMDTSGKDGVIRSVFTCVSPQGVDVASFKAPTPAELAHDFLWRVHTRVPGAGEMVLFNRSHYEDVLVVRVHDLVPPAVWAARYDQIREFEALLVASGTTVLKFFLHISKDEQRDRLQARLDDQTKHWKFRVGDLKERARWDDYMAAYEDALAKTSTDDAPWHIVPANHKWYRDLVVASVMVDTLEGLKMTYPESPDDLSGVVVS